MSKVILSNISIIQNSQPHNSHQLQIESRQLARSRYGCRCSLLISCFTLVLFVMMVVVAGLVALLCTSKQCGMTSLCAKLL